MQQQRVKISVRITRKPEYAGPPHLLRRPPHYAENLWHRRGRRRPPQFLRTMHKASDSQLSSIPKTQFT